MFKTYISPGEFNQQAAQFRPSPSRAPPAPPTPARGTREISLPSVGPVRVMIASYAPAVKRRKTDPWEMREGFRGVSSKKFDNSAAFNKGPSAFDQFQSSYNLEGPSFKWSNSILEAAYTFVKERNLPVDIDPTGDAQQLADFVARTNRTLNYADKTQPLEDMAKSGAVMVISYLNVEALVTALFDAIKNERFNVYVVFVTPYYIEDIRQYVTALAPKGLDKTPDLADRLADRLVAASNLRAATDAETKAVSDLERLLATPAPEKALKNRVLKAKKNVRTASAKVNELDEDAEQEDINAAQAALAEAVENLAVLLGDDSIGVPPPSTSPNPFATPATPPGPPAPSGLVSYVPTPLKSIASKLFGTSAAATPPPLALPADATAPVDTTAPGDRVRPPGVGYFASRLRGDEVDDAPDRTVNPPAIVSPPTVLTQTDAPPAVLPNVDRPKELAPAGVGRLNSEQIDAAQATAIADMRFPDVNSNRQTVMLYLQGVATRHSIEKGSALASVYEKLVQAQFFYPRTGAGDDEDRDAEQQMDAFNEFFKSKNFHPKTRLPYVKVSKVLEDNLLTYNGLGMAFGRGFAEDHIQEAGLIKDDKKVGQYLYMFKLV